jgi:hypothetical protein
MALEAVSMLVLINLAFTVACLYLLIEERQRKEKRNK